MCVSGEVNFGFQVGNLCWRCGAFRTRHGASDQYYAATRLFRRAIVAATYARNTLKTRAIDRPLRGNAIVMVRAARRALICNMDSPHTLGRFTRANGVLAEFLIRVVAWYQDIIRGHLRFQVF